MTFHNKLLAKKSFFHLPVPYQAVYLSFAANWVSGRGVRNFVLMGFPASHRVLPPREGWQRSPGIGGSFALEPASTSLALLALDHLWLAFMASSHIGFLALLLVGEDHGWLFFTMPPRSSVVI